MKRSITLNTALAAVLLCNAAAAPVTEIDSRILQRDFATATDLTIEPRWQHIEDAAATFLKYVGTRFVLGKPGFANIGEEWSPTDAVDTGLPRALHLFTAYSNKVTASIFIVGGRDPTTYALLAHIRAKKFCIFSLPEFSLTNLRISVVQDILRPNRDETISRIPQCEPQSLDGVLQLPTR